MNKDNRKNNKPDLLIIGFALLLPGVLLANIDDNRTFQIIGMILILAASAVFGASINSRISRKK